MSDSRTLFFPIVTFHILVYLNVALTVTLSQTKVCCVIFMLLSDTLYVCFVSLYTNSCYTLFMLMELLISIMHIVRPCCDTYVSFCSLLVCVLAAWCFRLLQNQPFLSPSSIKCFICSYKLLCYWSILWFIGQIHQYWSNNTTVLLAVCSLH